MPGEMRKTRVGVIRKEIPHGEEGEEKGGGEPLDNQLMDATVILVRANIYPPLLKIAKWTSLPFRCEKTVSWVTGSLCG